MQNQVQQLEELLARVKRNRARMAAESSAGRSVSRSVVSMGAPPVADIEPEEADIETEASVIDLVHPTSVAPTPDLTRPEDDFSSVAPVSAAPAAAAPIEEEVDVSAELPLSMSPEMPSASRSEDDFSSVAPVSAAPEAPATNVAEDAAAAVEIPPSMLPDEAPAAPLTGADESDESDELELVNTDTASMNPGMPQDAASYAMDEQGDEQPQHATGAISQAGAPEVEAVTDEQLEIKTYQRTASASGEVVDIKNKMPRQKSYTIDAVLNRAWQLGKNA